MLKTWIINAIKTVKAIKKRPDELSIYDFGNKVNSSVDIKVITNSLKTMIEIQKTENKLFNGKSSYYLIECKSTHSDGMNLPNPHSATPEILSTPFTEENTLNPAHWPNVEGKSILLSQVTQNLKIFSVTFNLNNSAYDNVKYKKIKDVLPLDIKTGICKFYKTKSMKD